MMDSMLPFGDRTGNLYFGRTPDGSCRGISISSGTLQEPAGGTERQPGGTRGYRSVSCISLRRQNNRAVPRSSGSLTGYLRATGLMKTPGDWEQTLRHTGAPTGCENCPGAREIGREPAGHRTKMAKMSIFIRRAGLDRFNKRPVL